MKKNILLSIAICLLLQLMIQAETAFSQESPEMKEGMRLFYEKNIDQAKESFHQVFKKEPQNSLALLFLLDCYAQGKNLQPILNELEEASLANPSSAIAKAHLGMGYFALSLLKRDVFDEAMNQFQEALKIDNNLAMGYLGLGIIYYKKRMIPRSRSYFSKTLKINPDDITALERLGEIFLLDDKNPNSALNLFSRIIELYPDYPDGYFYCGSSCKEAGDYEKAIEYYEKTMALDPLGVIKGYYAPERIGDIYFAQKNFAKAQEFYEKSLKINPDNVYAKRMLENSKNPPKEDGQDKTDGDKKQDGGKK